jgi:CRP-like cAMP-binding protein
VDHDHGSDDTLTQPFPEAPLFGPHKPGEPNYHGHFDVLGSLSPGLRQTIVDQCTTRRCRRGSVLWYQGDAAGTVAFVTRGKAVSTYHSQSGRIGVAGFWANGDLVGCGALSTPPTRVYTVKCLEDSQFLEILTARFDALMKREPELTEAVVRAISVRLRWVIEHLLTLETLPALQRLCTMLLALCDSFGIREDSGIRIDLKLTNDTLGAMVGITRQSTNLMLHDLRERGAIDLERRTVIVTDLAKLRHLAYDPELATQESL